MELRLVEGEGMDKRIPLSIGSMVTYPTQLKLKVLLR